MTIIAMMSFVSVQNKREAPPETSEGSAIIRAARIAAMTGLINCQRAGFIDQELSSVTDDLQQIANWLWDVSTEALVTGRRVRAL